MITTNITTFKTTGIQNKPFLNNNPHHLSFKSNSSDENIDKIRELSQELSEIRTDNTKFYPKQKNLMEKILNKYNGTYYIWDTMHSKTSSACINTVSESHQKYGTKMPSATRQEFHLNAYKRPDISVPLSSVGLDENIFFEDIQGILGDADFRNSEVQNLGSALYINGDANFYQSKVNDLGKIIFISGNSDFSNTNLKGDYLSRLGSIDNIDKKIHYFDSSKVMFPHLNLICGNINARNSELNMPELKHTLGINNKFDSCKINMPKLEKINYTNNFSNIANLNLPSLKNADTLIIEDSENVNLGKLERVNGDLLILNSNVKDISNLKKVNGNIKLIMTNLTKDDFKNIEIGGNLYISDSSFDYILNSR